MKTAILVITTTLFLYLLAWLIMSPLTFLGSDVGLRFLQIQELINNNWQSFAINYPARFVDPQLQHVPYYYGYLVVDNEIYFAISPFLPLFASFLYVALGTAGLPMVPVLGGVFTALAIYALAKLSDLRNPLLGFFITLFATPILFYCLELWDHTLGTAFALWGVYGIARGLKTKHQWPLFLGGASLGLALGQRPEFYIFALALAISTVIVSWFQWKRWLVVAGGGLSSLLPILVLQYLWFGHPLGMSVAPQLFGYGVPATYSAATTSATSQSIPAAIKAGYLLLHLEPRSILSAMAMVLVLSGTVLIILNLRSFKKQRTTLFAVGFLLTGLGYLLWAGVVVNGRPLIGLFSTFTLLPLSLTYLDARRWPHRSVYNLVLSTTLIFVGLMLIAWPAVGGVQWGARYLLPAYPLLVFLAMCTFTAYYPLLVGKQQMIFKWGSVGLIATGILLQLVGVGLLYVRHTQQVPLRNQLAALSTNVILTNEIFLPAAMSSVPKTFIHVNDEVEIRTILSRLDEQGTRQVGILSQQAVPLNVSSEIDDFSAKQIAPFIYLLTANN